MGNPVGTKY